MIRVFLTYENEISVSGKSGLSLTKLKKCKIVLQRKNVVKKSSICSPFSGGVRLFFFRFPNHPDPMLCKSEVPIGAP